MIIRQDDGIKVVKPDSRLGQAVRGRCPGEIPEAIAEVLPQVLQRARDTVFDAVKPLLFDDRGDLAVFDQASAQVMAAGVNTQTHHRLRPIPPVRPGSTADCPHLNNLSIGSGKLPGSAAGTDCYMITATGGGTHHAGERIGPRGAGRPRDPVVPSGGGYSPGGRPPRGRAFGRDGPGGRCRLRREGTARST